MDKLLHDREPALLKLFLIGASQSCLWKEDLDGVRALGIDYFVGAVNCP
jgi:hypothetical protein